MTTPYDELARQLYGESINDFARGSQYLEKHAIGVCYPAIAAMLVPEEYASLVLTCRMEMELKALITNGAHNLGNPDKLAFKGPLSTFAAKIKMAYFLGFITERMYHAIDCCRHIRNAYAHNENPYEARENNNYKSNRKSLLELDPEFTARSRSKMQALFNSAQQQDSLVSAASEVTAIMVAICDNLGSAAFFSKFAKSVRVQSVIPAFYGFTDICDDE